MLMRETTRTPAENPRPAGSMEQDELNYTSVTFTKPQTPYTIIHPVDIMSSPSDLALAV